MGGVDAPCLEAVGIVVVNVVAGRLVSAVHSQAEAVTVPSVLPGGVERGIMVGCGVDVEVLHVVIARIGGILRFRIGIAVPTAQHDVFRGAVVEGEVYAIDAGFREVGVFLAFLYFEELFFGVTFISTSSIMLRMKLAYPVRLAWNLLPAYSTLMEVYCEVCALRSVLP